MRNQIVETMDENPGLAVDQPKDQLSDIDILGHKLAEGHRQNVLLPPAPSAPHKPGEDSLHTPSGKSTPISSRINQYIALLEVAINRLRSQTSQSSQVSSAAEWLLDNYYVAVQALREVRQDLPIGFERRLPLLSSGRIRTYDIACEIIRSENISLDLDRVRRLLLAYQEVLPLSTGELWSIPTMLRLSILECLLYASVKLTELPANLSESLVQNWDISQTAYKDIQIDDQQVVENSIRSLRTIAVHDWKHFFESTSLVEATLAQDPAGIYSGMDFETRDHYRKVLEEIALTSHRDELEVARLVLASAQRTSADNHSDAVPAHPKNTDREPGWDSFQSPIETHVGYYLLGRGRPELEKVVGYRLRGGEKLLRLIRAHPTPAYLGAIGSLGLGLVYAIVLYVLKAGEINLYGAIPLLVLFSILALILSLTVAVNIINWGVTQIIHPSALPLMDFSRGVPEECATMVVIPAILSGSEEVDSLLEQLEQHFLRNPDGRFYFALLTDFVDAADQHLPGDDELIRLARQGIKRLNKKYSPREAGAVSQYDGSHDFFFLMHRERQWNSSEGVWMGWERKRGKLHELNRLIMATQDGLSGVEKYYPIREGNFAFLKYIRYVITLDADTILPRDAAQELVATLAHPLNRAVFAPRMEGRQLSERVEAGYTILQPRTDINPLSSARSIFARIFSGDMGLDLYTRAVSDVYQDLFGEGIYVGKGIYEVRSFERSLEGRIPENTLLSHDLFEGIHGRVGLVTSIALVEDIPFNYLEHVRRLRRWIRGDWQLLPWLLSSQISTISRWKILDNLRRSLVAPALLIWLVLGCLVLPGPTWVWIVSGALFLAIPIINGLLGALRGRLSGQPIGSSGAIVRDSIYRWFFALAFLPYEAWLGVDAILATLLRLTITHRGMLRWTTSRQVSRLLGNSDTWTTWKQMAKSTLLSLGLAGLIGFFRIQALVFAAPLLVVWLIGPGIAAWIGKPRRKHEEKLDNTQKRGLHRLARQTWLFFEQFTGPEDHWLPPDHYQESPLGIVAHHTSPTNIGLTLLSTLGAYDLGYLEMLNLVVRLQSSLDSIEKLERYRGHLLNWYDTRSLEPLHPRYVSTVDSGNLAACLLALREGCLEIPDRPVLRWETFEGLLDTIDLLDEVIRGLNSSSLRPLVSVLRNTLSAITREIHSAKETPERWVGLLLALKGTAAQGRNTIKSWSEVNHAIANLVSKHASQMNAKTLHLLGIYNQSVQHQLDNILRYIDNLLPWHITFRELPALFRGEMLPADFEETWQELRKMLAANVSLVEIPTVCQEARTILGRLSDLFVNQDGVDHVTAMDWIREQEKIFDTATMNAKTLLLGFENVANRCETLFQEMDFSFLFDLHRKVFHIGYNVTAEGLDLNYYDLLASEARLASLIAIGKGDVPKSHWLYLSRPFARVNGRQALISWSATMFEYLMPTLFVENLPGTMWDQTIETVIDRQIDYGREKMIPWGISESGYYRFDQNQNYQYRAFGVPGLGYKRGMGDFLVVTPYASLLALQWRPRSVYKNLELLTRLGMQSTYGFYEAIDFTQAHLPDNQKTAPVLSYMAHHQGMILLSLVNYLQTNAMVRRFHCDPRVKSVALMLMERIPYDIPFEIPGADGLQGLHHTRTKVTTIPWQVDPLAHYPRVHTLSNGRFTTLVTAAGGGYSTWEGIDLTRWRSDPTTGRWGTWIYVQDRDNRAFWSVSLLPTMLQGDEHETFFDSHVAEFRRRDRDLSQTVAVFIAPDNDVEIRLVTLTNHGDKPQHLSLISYGEVIISSHEEEIRHPAFNKLFIESGKLDKGNGLLFHRRPRSESEEPVYLAHAVINDSGGLTSFFQGTHPPRLETNRRNFLGRNRTARNPVILETGLSDLRGASPDPIFSIRQDVDLAAHSTVRVAFLMAAAQSADGCHIILGHYETLASIQAALDRARVLAEMEMTEMAITSNYIKNYQTLLSMLVFPSHILRSPAERLAANQKGQPGLWKFAISGDYPILMARIIDDEGLPLANDLLQAHKFWRKRKLAIDLVFLLDLDGGYQQVISTQLSNLIGSTDNSVWLNRRGGIFTIHAGQIDEKDRILLESAARVVLNGTRGDLAAQLQHTPDLDLKSPRLPPLSTSLPSVDSEPTPPLIRPDTLLYDNQFGGFSPGGEEYCIYLAPGQATPAPWTNVIANSQFGFLTSESGLGVTWSENSSENRLSTWENDPVSDQPGEALYLRDEEAGIVWSPTPGPAPAPAPYLVRHGAGYTIFEHQSHGLNQRTRVFSPPDDPLKLIHLRLENTWSRARRVTITYYVEWVLGVHRENTQQYLIPEFNSEPQVLMVRNPYNMDFPDRVAFVAASKPLHGLTADRTEFLGRLGSIAQPAALARIGLEGTVQAGLDPCAALQLHIDLDPGEWKEVHFLLGQAEDRDAVIDIVRRYKEPAQVELSWESNRRRWDELLGMVQVQTPEPSFDLLLNRWLLYQTLACRIWGRTALYQSSGAYGFRDQLQDILSLLYTTPELAREHILRAARHQFEAGDVLHWWHPPNGRGVRTRFSDDLLWLPYATAEYVIVTGDESILTEKIPFRRSTLLDPGQAERYGVYQETNEIFTLFEHCRRAIEKGATLGHHNLPLMGGGDWNDGMNRVGIQGRGESVWLAWFLYDTLNRFADLCQRRGQDEPAAGYRHRASNLAQAIEQSSWDGNWYLRAFYDDGTALGSSRNLECQIDSIPQSWAVLSGGGNPERTVEAMRSVFERLVKLQESLVMLFTPPFDTSPQDPGYIKGYRPGLRENGGQYTHAAIWVAWASLDLGWIDPGFNIFQALNPIKHADTREKAILYRVEPYVVAADIYSAPPFTGQGGWTWYTGSSGWMYRLGLEKFLGLKKRGSSLEVTPHIPNDWAGYTIIYRYGAAIYHIQIDNPQHLNQGVLQISLDGILLPDKKIPLSVEAKEHQVNVLMG
jgi:cyclic beta-1,2-glucan synthetase